MLSRVAESIYWMSRYIERAENVARFIEVNSHMALDTSGEENAQWMPLVTITGDEDLFLEKYGTPTRESVIRFLAFDAENPNSVISCLNAARENARSVRPRISTDMWEQINRMYLFVNRASTIDRFLESPHEFYTQVKSGSHLFFGITDSTLSHGEAWNFYRVGMMLERADQTSRLIDVKYFILLPDVDHVGLSVDDIQWAAVLRSAGALEMYRQCHGLILPLEIVNFLLLSRDFPRAALFCLTQAEVSLREISGTRHGMVVNQAEQRLGHLRSDLTYARVGEIITSGLHGYLDTFQLRLNGVGAAMQETFFLPRPVVNRW